MAEEKSFNNKVISASENVIFRTTKPKTALY